MSYVATEPAQWVKFKRVTRLRCGHWSSGRAVFKICELDSMDVYAVKVFTIAKCPMCDATWEVKP
jgi:hypothetical protein